MMTMMMMVDSQHSGYGTEIRIWFGAYSVKIAFFGSVRIQ